MLLKVIFDKSSIVLVKWNGECGYFMNTQTCKGDNIYYRKDGRWEGRYAIGRKTNGRLKYGYVYSKSYQTVKEKLFPLQQRSKKMMSLFGKSLMSYEEWISQWKKDIQPTIKESTYSGYCYKLERYLLPYLGSIQLYQLDTEKIQELVDHLITELSPSSIHIIIGLLKKTINDARNQGLLFSNPCDSIKLPKRNRQKVHALTVDEQRALMRAVNSIGSDNAQATTLALNTGMRIGEIAALTWKNIDFSRGVISVEKTCQRLLNEENHTTYIHYDTVKSISSNRIIPMNQQIKRVLQKLKRNSTSEFVFAINEKGCEPRILTNYFHQVRKMANLENIHFHQLRHTFATRCLEANIGIATVSALLGHASAKMTLDVYSDSMMNERVAAVHAIERQAI